MIRKATLFLFLMSLCYSQIPSPTPLNIGEPKKQQTRSSHQPTDTDQRGTEQSPLVVKEIPTPKTQEESAQESRDHDEKAANDRISFTLTGIIAAIALGQFIVYWYQSIQLKKTVKAAGEQSEAMERHIGEATRSANAMEEIAATIKKGNREAMRAYLTVIVANVGLWQQRREGQPDLKFEARPILSNTGNTPARKVKHMVVADILPNPIPETFTFPMPQAEEVEKSQTIGAHVSTGLAGTLNDFVEDAEVPSIKEGNEKILAVWGLITYEDVYGDPHWVKFAHMYRWIPNGNFEGYYIAGHNDTD